MLCKTNFECESQWKTHSVYMGENVIPSSVVLVCRDLGPVVVAESAENTQRLSIQSDIQFSRLYNTWRGFELIRLRFNTKVQRGRSHNQPTTTALECHPHNQPPNWTKPFTISFHFTPNYFLVLTDTIPPSSTSTPSPQTPSSVSRTNFPTLINNPLPPHHILSCHNVVTACLPIHPNYQRAKGKKFY